MSEQQYTEIGEKLRAARQAKGLTLDDLQQQTKIQKRYLNAIENGEFDQLPGDFYVRAFTKQFATAVDINADELLATAPQEVAAPQTDLSESRTDLDNVTRTGMNNQVTKAEKVQSIVPKVIIAVLVVLVLGGIWAVSQLGSSSHTARKADSSNVSVSSSKVVDKQKVEADKKAAEADAASSKADVKASSKKAAAKKLTIAKPTVDGASTSYKVKAAKATKHTLTVGTKYKTWLTISTDDGKTLASEMLAPNTSKKVTLPATVGTVTIRSGYALGTTLKLDKKNVKVPDSTLTTRNFEFTFNDTNASKSGN
ncbi:helix-turn-helix domain-containing protein [Periweissella cryptocerci]|nr:helix-turn-helix transcriptional regulator [Periweissella cryptocerci]